LPRFELAHARPDKVDAVFGHCLASFVARERALNARNDIGVGFAADGEFGLGAETTHGLAPVNDSAGAVLVFAYGVHLVAFWADGAAETLEDAFACGFGCSPELAALAFLLDEV
jgi:hypothetical protein